mmetsp:Transcript_15488/g.32585  ORF Transcript_15488/g.32585 Transcript_15488/m.32585 type:complete len:407 (+) Transcript_15488:148-1368(+)
MANLVHRRRLRHILSLASLCLSSFPSGSLAFSTSGPLHLDQRVNHCMLPSATGSIYRISSVYTKRRRDGITKIRSSAMDMESSATPSDPIPLSDPLSIECNANDNRDNPADLTNLATNLQSRQLALPSPAFDINTVINLAILLLAILTVLHQILSIDTHLSRGWTPEEIATRIPLDNWISYNHILSIAPLPTKAVTSATVYTIGDIIAQSKEGAEIGKLDRWRTLRSLIAGMVGHGPMSHVWYHVSEDFFETTLKLDHVWWDFLPKVVVDQTIFGPIWNNSYIFLLGIMQLRSPKVIWEDMRRTTVPLVLEGLKLWPFVHCITYGLIPVENRLLWVDAVEIVWVTILASQASGKGKEGESVVIAEGGDVGVEGQVQEKVTLEADGVTRMNSDGNVNVSLAMDKAAA